MACRHDVGAGRGPGEIGQAENGHETRDPERAEKEWSGACVEHDENSKQCQQLKRTQWTANKGPQTEPVTEADIVPASFLKASANDTVTAELMQVKSDLRDDREH